MCFPPSAVMVLINMLCTEVTLWWIKIRAYYTISVLFVLALLLSSLVWYERTGVYIWVDILLFGSYTWVVILLFDMLAGSRVSG